MLLSVLYIIGITAEGITGALAAGREKMDIFGVIIIACVTAIGGGTVRDVLLGHYPVGWVKHPEYFIMVAGAAVLTVFIAPFIKHFMRILHSGLKQILSYRHSCCLFKLITDRCFTYSKRIRNIL